jgi:hypothetical protein
MDLLDIALAQFRNSLFLLLREDFFFSFAVKMSFYPGVVLDSINHAGIFSSLSEHEVTNLTV